MDRSSLVNVSIRSMIKSRQTHPNGEGSAVTNQRRCALACGLVVRVDDSSQESSLPQGGSRHSRLEALEEDLSREHGR